MALRNNALREYCRYSNKRTRQTIRPLWKISFLKGRPYFCRGSWRPNGRAGRCGRHRANLVEDEFLARLASPAVGGGLRLPTLHCSRPN